MIATQPELLAGDLMTIDPIVVAADAPLDDAERLMRTCRVSGLPVTDSDGVLVGVVSQTDLVHLENPDVRHLLRRPNDVRVGDVMSRPPVTVLVDTPVLEAARLMSREQIHRVVVVDGRRRPLGVLAAMDFVTLYAEG